MMPPTQHGPPPRSPHIYEEADHLEDAFADDMRFLDRDMVEETIINGRDYPKEGGPGKMRRKYEYDGVDVVVVIDPKVPCIITAWTEINSTSRALASSRWTTDDLQTIRAFMDKLHKRPGTWQV